MLLRQLNSDILGTTHASALNQTSQERPMLRERKKCFMCLPWKRVGGRAQLLNCLHEASTRFKYLRKLSQFLHVAFQTYQSHLWTDFRLTTFELNEYSLRTWGYFAQVQNERLASQMAQRSMLNEQSTSNIPRSKLNVYRRHSMLSLQKPDDFVTKLQGR